MAHRSGFVCIIGNPNVGKSTLMNALVGEKLSIVTAKAQTTRHRIMGIVNGDDWQIVYSDTPGILKPSYRLQQNMMNFVDGAIGDADVILYVTDTVETPDKNSEYLFKVLCYKTKNVFFIFLCFLMCYLCEKYHKPITVQYYVINCVSWVARLTLLNL